MIDEAKVLLGIDDDDELLSIYEKQGQQKIMNRLGTEDVPSQFLYIIVEFIVFKYRKRGIEDSTSVKEDVLSKNLVSDNDFFMQYEREFKKFEQDRKKSTLKFLRG